VFEQVEKKTSARARSSGDFH